MHLSKGTVHIYMPGVNMPPPSEELHMIGAFVINSEVVQTGIYSKEFFDLYHSSTITEVSEDPNNGFLTINFYDNRDGLDMNIILDPSFGSIVLSNPSFVEVPEGYEWVFPGIKYINGEFVDDRKN